MRKKIALVSLALVFAVTSFAGCGGRQDTVVSGSNSGSEPGLEADEDTVSEDGLGHIGNGEDITLKVLTVQEDEKILKKMADDFARKYKDDVKLTMELEACPQEEIKEKMLTNLELAADIYTFPSSDFQFLAESNALQEVSLNTDKIIEENGGIEVSTIQAATYNGKLFAYPLAYNNGQVLYYNKKYFSEKDVDSLGTLIHLASENGKFFSMDFTSGLYLWSFFGGAGFRLVLNDDGSHMCDINGTTSTGIKGADVLRAMMNICRRDGFLSLTEEEFVQRVRDDSVIAGISSISNADAVKQAWKDDYAAAKLPSYVLGGVNIQMTSFADFQLIGINPYSKNVGWAMRFAEWMTNEKNQLARFQARGLVPTIRAASDSELLKEDVTAMAVARQGQFTLADGIQTDHFWEPMASLGGFCLAGNFDETIVQAFLDDTVEKITKPVKQEE